MPEVIKISLERKEQPVDIEGKIFKIREMDGLELGEWREKMAGRMKINATGHVVGMREYGGSEAILIAACMVDDKGERVPADRIKLWPVSVQMQLVRVCRDINGLNEGEEGEKK